MEIKLGNKLIGDGHPAYIIAEVGSNFDGNFDRAKRLIELAKDAGADSVKFQYFYTSKIICPEGFKGNSSFQSKWKKSVAEVYKEAEFPREWQKSLIKYSKERGIDFSSSPYDFDAVDLMSESEIPYIKIGSGEITNIPFLKYVAKKGKPVILATGASDMDEIKEAVEAIRSEGNSEIILLQCVTNYPSPVKDANIRAMQLLREKFGCLVGYSDHTNDPGNIVPLGAVALGACVIEKHFTDDRTRNGPDHPFAMDHHQFKSMVQEVRLLEASLGEKEKKVYPSEVETKILQRRGIHAAKDIVKGKILEKSDLEILRPAPEGGVLPKDYENALGKKIKRSLKKGETLLYGDFS